MSEQATATLHIEVTVNCPLCDAHIDLLNPSDTGGQELNDCGEVLKDACPTDGRHWVDAHKSYEVDDVTCSECGSEFDVKGIWW